MYTINGQMVTANKFDTVFTKLIDSLRINIVRVPAPTVEKSIDTATNTATFYFKDNKGHEV